MRATPSFPIVKSSHSRIFYDFSWHIGLVIGNLWGPSVAHGGPSEPENGQNMTSQRVLSTFPASNAQFSHSEILYLNFSSHTRLSIGNHFGPSGVLGDPSKPINGQNLSQVIRYRYMSTFYVSNTQLFP